MNYSNVNSKNSGVNPSAADSLKILSSPDLVSLTGKWAAEYSRLNPGTKIKIITVSDAASEKLISGSDIGFVSGEFYASMKKAPEWKVVVGRDVIVPVINSQNPFLEDICTRGVSPESFSAFLNSPGVKSWGTLLKNDEITTATYYYINDKSIKEGLSDFLNTEVEGKNGISVNGPEELISALRKDRYAIGFCKMVNIIDLNSQKIADNLHLLPIDRNGNNLIDFNEAIYDDINELSRGVWIGKYPKTLISNIYSISPDQPEKDAEIAFLKWVLADGQKYLLSSGFTELLAGERQAASDKIFTAKIYSGSTVSDKSIFRPLLFILTGLILAGVIIRVASRLRRAKKSAAKVAFAADLPLLDKSSLVVPAGLYFDKTHTWAFMDQNGIVKVGIDDFLQHITGKITRIKMKSPGKVVKKGEQIVSVIQNGKQLSLYSPVSGKIVEMNKALESDTSVINSSPYSDGWIYKIEPSNWIRENPLLFMADRQREFIKSEFARLRDFLAKALTTGTESYSQLVLQDGGEVRDGVLSNLGPEVWDDFQTKFIDPSRQIFFYELF